jgi:hypothetical protein
VIRPGLLLLSPRAQSGEICRADVRNSPLRQFVMDVLGTAPGEACTVHTVRYLFGQGDPP